MLKYFGAFLYERRFHIRVRHAISAPRQMYRGTPRDNVLNASLYHVARGALSGSFPGTLGQIPASIAMYKDNDVP